MHELSERHGVKMQQIALAWHWAKGVASPIAGAIDHNPAEGVMLLDPEYPFSYIAFTVLLLLHPSLRQSIIKS